jgi:hypothetical protein
VTSAIGAPPVGVAPWQVEQYFATTGCTAHGMPLLSASTLLVALPAGSIADVSPTASASLPQETKRALASTKVIKFDRFTQTSQRAAERCTELLINGRRVVFSSPMRSFNVDLTGPISDCIDRTGSIDQFDDR